MKKLKSAEEYTLQYENTVFSIVDVIRMVQIDAIKTTAENCAEEVRLNIDGICENSNGQNYIVDEGNHYCETSISIDKQSILNVADKMIEEL